MGFKPAGGIRTGKDACTWLILIKEELGEAWLNNNLFRIGASGLLIDIERQLFHYITGRYAASHELAMSWSVILDIKSQVAENVVETKPFLKIRSIACSIVDISTTLALSIIC